MTRIAIVGMSCRFPGAADTLDSYWDLLQRGACAIREIPKNRWSLDGFYDPRPDIPTRSYSKWGGFLTDVKSFDPAFFDLSPREAEAMDPQQRILLEVAYEAVQDAGLTLESLRTNNTGVFVGASNIDYNLLQRFRHDRGDILAGTGNALSIVANRVSNTLSLTGPSIVTDTACSSSLVALDTACRHLLDGSCGAALVGGANILLDPRMFITFSRAHMLSPTGRIYAFDARADGFVRGEGVGLVLLKRLDEAEAAGDRVYATVEATAINQDGGTGTITAPNPDAQVSMMRAVLKRSGLLARDVAYAEAHGTGTSVGDPIEVNAIGRVFGGAGRDAPLLIGSSKTNLGHLEPAAGIAGLIKTALVLSRGQVPPTAGYETPNPKIDFVERNIEVVTEGCKPLGSRDVTAALVNSFGFGGTNACALLTKHHNENVKHPRAHSTNFTSKSAPTPEENFFAFPLSAPTDAHLRAYAETLASELGSGALQIRPLVEIGHALGNHRDHFSHRAVVIADSHETLREKLHVLATGEPWPRARKNDPPGIITGHAKRTGKLAFTMTGQGGQWWAMGRALLQSNPQFRSMFEEFDTCFQPLSGWSVIDAMIADENDSQLDDAAITPAVMFAFQCGLAEIWRSVGVVPDLVIGHSFGEVTAAYLAGGISMKQVAKLVLFRGLIRGSVDRVGTMAAIGLGAEDAQTLLPENGSVEIGGYNSPNLVTLTGEETAIDKIIADLNHKSPDIVTRKLALDFAYHSSWFEPVEEIFKSNLGVVQTSSPKIPVVSTVTGLENDRFDVDYWWSNLRYPVRYQDGINCALELGADTFIELGPTRTLSSMTAGCAAANDVDVTTVSTLHRTWNDFESVATAIGQLYCSGRDIDWFSVFPSSGEQLELPKQPWLHETFWHAPECAERALQKKPSHSLLGDRDNTPGHSWTQRVSLDTQRILSDHQINNQIVYPAACYIEAIYEAGSIALATEHSEIRTLKFHSALFLHPDEELEFRTTVDTERNQVAIHTRIVDGNKSWMLRASGHILPCNKQPVSSIKLGVGEHISSSDFYNRVAELGYHYGPTFRRLERISVDRSDAFARLTKSDVDNGSANTTNLPAPLLDSALQLMLAWPAPIHDAQNRGDLFLPTGIDRISITAPLISGCNVLARQRPQDTETSRSSDFAIHSDDGLTCITITNLTARAWGSDKDINTYDDRIYREELIDWSCSEHDSNTTGPWLILRGRSARLVSDLADAVECIGAHSQHIHRTDRKIEDASDDWLRLLAKHLNGAPSTVEIVYQPDYLPDAQKNSSELTAAIDHHTREMVALGRALHRLGKETPMNRVWVLNRTMPTTALQEHARLDTLQHASLLGVVRTLKMEFPDVPLTTVALNLASEGSCTTLHELISTRSEETEFIVSDGKIKVPRLRRAAGSLRGRAFSVDKSSTNYKLEARSGAGFESLQWLAQETRPPRVNEVQVEVTHVGLNFRDVMAVTGLLPPDAESSPAHDALGLEFAGRVITVGDNVEQFTLDERVFGMTRGALVRRLNITPNTLFSTPGHMTDAESAAQCSAFLTASYALNSIGRLAEGEKLLIHNATGAVGLAAVTLAQAAGAEIFATAGKPAKRDYLSKLALAEVLDSRSLSFADEILELTDGYGVDLILNALPGPYIDKALDCLAPYGRFLEVGKRDVYADRAIGLRSLRANQSFHVIDVAAMLTDRPDTVRTIINELMPHLESGTICPVPHQIFPARQIVGAFQHFAAAEHIGKIVIDQTDPEMKVQTSVTACPALDSDGTYLVTGGTRGMGLQVARWLRDHGAGHVIASSRTGKCTEDSHHASDVRSSEEGPHAFYQLDVTDAQAVDQIVAQIQASGKPLKGIIHAAVIYDDALVQDMTDTAIKRVTAPKFLGAMNLSQAILKSAVDLDFFLSFSSIACITGWPGQSNYTAANASLEALALWQRVVGIPGQCIHWGVFGDTGHVADSASMSRYLENAGWNALSVLDVGTLLGTALNSDEPVLTIADVDWDALTARHPAIEQAPRLNGLVDNRAGHANPKMFAFGSCKSDVMGHALRIVREQVAKVLRVPTESIVGYETILDAGIDSLSAFELRNRLEQESNLEVPIGRFVEAFRIDELADLLCELAVEQRDAGNSVS